MNKLLSFIPLVLAFSPLAQAASQAKLTARSCADSAAPAEIAQAALFSSGGKTYAVTPLSSVLRVEKFLDCIELEADGQRVTARRVAWDFLFSTALLELDRPLTAPSLDSWKQAPAAPTLIQLGTGEQKPVTLLMRSTDRHTYSHSVGGAPAHFTEIRASTPIDTDGRGSLVLTDRTHPTAMVMDEYLEMQPGHPTRIRKLTRENGPQMHLVTVSLTSLADWVSEILSGRANPGAQPRLLVSKYDPRQVGIASGGLLLDADCPPEGESIHPSGKYPIGGKEGGNNGVGHRIGGEDLAGALCKIIITKDPKGGRAVDFIVNRPDWVRTMLKLLDQTPLAEAWYSLNEARAPEHEGGYSPLGRIGFSHLKFFLRLLAEGKTEPAILLPAGVAPLPGYLADTETLSRIDDTFRILRQPMKVENPALLELRRYIFSILSVLHSQQWQKVSRSDIRMGYDPDVFEMSRAVTGTTIASEHPFTEAWFLLPVAYSDSEANQVRANLEAIAARL